VCRPSILITWSAATSFSRLPSTTKKLLKLNTMKRPKPSTKTSRFRVSQANAKKKTKRILKKEGLTQTCSVVSISIQRRWRGRIFWSRFSSSRLSYSSTYARCRVKSRINHPATLLLWRRSKSHQKRFRIKRERQRQMPPWTSTNKICLSLESTIDKLSMERWRQLWRPAPKPSCD